HLLYLGEHHRTNGLQMASNLAELAKYCDGWQTRPRVPPKGKSVLRGRPLMNAEDHHVLGACRGSENYPVGSGSSRGQHLTFAARTSRGLCVTGVRPTVHA